MCVCVCVCVYRCILTHVSGLSYSGRTYAVYAMKCCLVKAPYRKSVMKYIMLDARTLSSGKMSCV